MPAMTWDELWTVVATGSGSAKLVGIGLVQFCLIRLRLDWENKHIINKTYSHKYLLSVQISMADFHVVVLQKSIIASSI